MCLSVELVQWLNRSSALCQKLFVRVGTVFVGALFVVIVFVGAFFVGTVFVGACNWLSTAFATLRPGSRK